MRVKVCGVTREADLRAVADAGADAVGVIAGVSVDTPREVSVDRAADLVAAAPPFLSTTLVTMPDTPDEAAALADRVGADHLQVHGLADPDALAALRERTRARLLAVVDADDPDVARAAAPRVDALLVDSVSAGGGGGTGETHDWTATRDLVESLDVPVVLAGGLTPDNVAEAVATADPYGVDAASGVERTGGVKDHDAVAAFVANARGTRGVSA
jgi:phosphoribosylanthranilate isomerase